jgi:hypothetical protein
MFPYHKRETPDIAQSNCGPGHGQNKGKGTSERLSFGSYHLLTNRLDLPKILIFEKKTKRLRSAGRFSVSGVRK